MKNYSVAGWVPHPASSTLRCVLGEAPSTPSCASCRRCRKSFVMNAGSRPSLQELIVRQRSAKFKFKQLSHDHLKRVRALFKPQTDEHEAILLWLVPHPASSAPFRVLGEASSLS
ncbi:MAG TPA: hypothetical protein VHL14_15865, partial [Steroidobacteraceae bacterium]|nr:hypothetical protein [Steroidobacteraceae bacterium]